MTDYSTSVPKKKICLVTEELASVGTSGGIGGAFYELSVALAAHHHVDLLYCPIELPTVEEQSRIQAQYLKRNVRLRYLNAAKYAWDGSSVEARSYGVYQDLNNCDITYDVIHFHDYKGLGFYPMAARSQGLDFAETVMIVQLHGPTRWTLEANDSLFTYPEQLKIDYMEQKCISSADYVVSPSAYLFDWLNGKNWTLPAEDRCFVIKNICKGVLDLTKSHKTSIVANPQRLADVREVVFFGRHEFRKGFSAFCDAIDILRDKLASKNINVTFLGGFGRIAEEHTGLILARRGRNWKFPVAVLPAHDRIQASRYLSEAAKSVVVVPSPIENSPYTVLEAVALNRPVITSAQGGAIELLDPSVHEEMTTAITPEGLAAAIDRAITEGISYPMLAEPLEETERRWLAFHDDLIAPTSKIAANPQEEPLVTVGITHFERPEKLIEAVTSIARQTYKNIELIVVDDGSASKSTVEALTSVEVFINRLGGSLIRRQNGYLGAARNSVAAVATGKYLCFLDDDDIAFPEMIATLVKAATHSGADVVNCLNIFMPESRRSEAWPVPTAFKSRVSYLPLGGPLSLTPIQNTLGAATALISRRCFDEVGGYTEIRGVGHEDYEFFVRATQAGFQISICPVPLYLYEVDRPSMISSTSSIRNYKRVVDAISVEDCSESWKDFISLCSGREALKWARDRRNYLINMDPNADLVREFEAEAGEVPQLHLLADYCSAINSPTMKEVYRRSCAHYGNELGSLAIEYKKDIAVHRLFEPQRRADAADRTRLSDAMVDILLGRPEQAADRIKHRVVDQGYLSPLDITDIRALITEPVEPEAMLALLNVVKYSLISENHTNTAAELMFALAVKSGDHELVKRALSVIIERDCETYMCANKDVADHAEDGDLLSAFEHYINYGRSEGRNGFDNVSKAHAAFIAIAKNEIALGEFIDRFGGRRFFADSKPS